MRTKTLIIWSLSLFSLILCAATSVFALRCYGRVVSEGDLKYDVLAKCGEPTWVETREEVHIETYGADFYGLGGQSDLYSAFQRVVKVLIEEWIYNFGPHRLIYHLRFENGVLKDIWTGGHGYLQK